MATHLEHDCELHPNPNDCADAVIVYLANRREYGLPLHDGGSSHIVINNCPWCGSQLPRTLMDDWEEAVHAAGFDPDDDDAELPAELEWATWMEAHSQISETNAREECPSGATPARPGIAGVDNACYEDYLR